MNHLLVTNDFPPKVGGIQSYLWELWRRLPPGQTTVLTAAHAGARAFDAAQPFRVERWRSSVLLPTPALVRGVERLADEVDAGVVLVDPALPLGLVGPRLSRPYGLVLHGAEVTVPGRLPASRQVLATVLRGARLVVAAGGYPLAEAERAAGAALPAVVVPPGVDVERFQPSPDVERKRIRHHLGLEPDGRLVVSVSRLVPRKGMDVLIRAVADLAEERPDLALLIVGTGRDRGRLQRLAIRTGAPVRFLGAVPGDELPGLYGAADVFAMLCRNRWGGLEQEGFGIVFLEAAAAGVAAVAGASGGAAEAVDDGRTGLVVDRPDDPAAVGAALADLLDDRDRREEMGERARARAEAEFSYDVLAARLAAALAGAGDGR